MSTIQTILIVLAAFVIGMSVVLFPRVKKAVISVYQTRKVAKEVKADLPNMKDSEFDTPCGNAEGRWKDAKIVWVKLKGGKKYSSVEDLLSNESMELDTSLWLKHIERRLSNVRKAKVIHRPEPITVFKTKEMIGQDLYVYHPGSFRVGDSERVQVKIDKLPNGHLDIVQILIAPDGLETGNTIQEINFLKNDKDDQGYARYDAIANEYFTSEEYRAEDEVITRTYERLEFYNSIVVDQKAAEIVNGKLYLKDHVNLPNLTTRSLTEEKEENHDSSEKQVRDEIAEAIRSAAENEVLV